MYWKGTNTLHAFVKESPLVSTTQEDFGWIEMYWMGTNTLHAFVKEPPLVSRFRLKRNVLDGKKYVACFCIGIFFSMH